VCEEEINKYGSAVVALCNLYSRKRQNKFKEIGMGVYFSSSCHPRGQ